ncbi:MAG: PAS domain S-box protein, partial [Methanomicrobiales archaeon]|nr:PAS domain S-box protein [Methanomicrobiales archaeon]
VFNREDRIIGHVGTITDITGRKKIEQALLESEEEYRALTENTSDVLFSINMAGIFTYISPQVNKYGYLVDEIIGKTLREIIHPEDLARVENDLARDLEKGAQFHSTFRVLDKWGNVHWFDEEGTLRLDQYGKPLGIYGVLRDDSERKRSEEQLIESKNLYMAIFDNTGSATIIIASDTSIILANPGWATLTGIPKEDSIGRSWTEFIHPEDLEKMKKYHEDRRVDPLDVPREYLFRLIDASGNTHSCIVSVVMIPGTTDSIAAIVDISERKRAEDAIELANRKLNLMNNITRHDILNTITGLLGCVDMANATSSPEEKMQLLNDIRDLTRIIQRQIAFTREYQEVGVHLPLWQNVHGVIDSVLQNFEKTGIHFEVNTGDMEVYADPLLEKVFYNLVDNAMRYGETITRIRISTQVSGNCALLIFEDDGTGIRKKYRHGPVPHPGNTRNYGHHDSGERCSRKRGTVRDTGPMGCIPVCQRHRATWLKILDRLTTTLSFHLVITMVEKMVIPIEDDDIIVPDIEKSILLVEDDDIIARVADWRLINLGYLVCGRATTAAEAMELVVNKKPDLVLMDINIKGDIDGIETAKMIKQGFSIPVIFVTSHSDGITLERAKAANPDGFIVKPFDDNDLRVAIELALKK